MSQVASSPGVAFHKRRDRQTGLMLSGCNVFDGLESDSTMRRILASVNDLTYRVQRWLAHSDAIAYGVHRG